MSSSNHASPNATRAPLAATLLAAAAVFPLTTLLGMALLGVVFPGIDNRHALLTYAAIVLTFLGAVHWGLATVTAPEAASPWGSRHEWRSYTVSMVPGFAGWIALLAPLRFGYGLTAAGLLALFAYDRWCTGHGEMPAWLLRLRTMVIVVAVACLALGYLFGRG